MKQRTGYIFEKDGKFFARVTFTDSRGIRRNLKRTAKTKSEANGQLRKLLNQLSSEGEKGLDAEKVTFSQLLDYYEETYAKKAKFVDERKVEGLRDVGRVNGFIKQFRLYFGKMKLRQLTYDDILKFRSVRLETHTHYKKPRMIATMNRELACLRRILNIAERLGWILRNPFNSGESLIDVSAERRRERTLSFDEEGRLLAACTGKRQHLRPFLICLLATGARKGETLKLTWDDVDFERRLITYRALNTKTLKTRKVGMTGQLLDELTKLWNSSDKNTDSRVFGFSYVRNSFESACAEANIETGRPFGITLHSLRHTFATRLVTGNFQLQFTARILGHQSVNTTYRYLSASDETLFKATEILEAFQAQKSELEAEGYIN